MSYDVIQNKQKSKKKKITESICFSKISVNNINWHNLPAEVATSPTLESNHSRPDLAVTSKTFCSCIHTLKQKPNLQYAEGGHLIKKEEEEENMCMQA